MKSLDWPTILSTFGILLLAELGDKTQWMTLSLAGSSQSRWAVFIGASLALVLSTGLAVLVGSGLTRIISPRVLTGTAGLFFIGYGLWTIAKLFES